MINEWKRSELHWTTDWRKLLRDDESCLQPIHRVNINEPVELWLWMSVRQGCSILWTYCISSSLSAYLSLSASLSASLPILHTVGVVRQMILSHLRLMDITRSSMRRQPLKPSKTRTTRRKSGKARVSPPLSLSIFLYSYPISSHSSVYLSF